VKDGPACRPGGDHAERHDERGRAAVAAVTVVRENRSKGLSLEPHSDHVPVATSRCLRDGVGWSRFTSGPLLGKREGRAPDAFRWAPVSTTTLPAASAGRRRMPRVRSS